jgi:hypothetical protein
MNLSGSLSRQDLTGIPPVESQWKCSSSLPLCSHFKIPNNISISTKKQEQNNYIQFIFLVDSVIPTIIHNYLKMSVISLSTYLD